MESSKDIILLEELVSQLSNTDVCWAFHTYQYPNHDFSFFVSTSQNQEK